MKDWLTVFFAALAVISPIIAAWFTIKWQSNKEKRDLKIRLFTELMAARKSNQISPQSVNALNLIDVVFSDTPTVVNLWHEYFEELSRSQLDLSVTNRRHLQLLSEMARSLGYNQLQQIDIDMFYYPMAHDNQVKINSEIQEHWLRILKSTEKFLVEPRQQSQQNQPAQASQV